MSILNKVASSLVDTIREIANDDIESAKTISVEDTADDFCAGLGFAIYLPDVDPFARDAIAAYIVAMEEDGDFPDEVASMKEKFIELYGEW